MKTLYYFFAICFIFAACKKSNIPEEPEDEPCHYVEFIQPLLECMNMPRPDDSYCYTCYIGTKNDECFKTGWNDDWIEAFQIPTTILEEMSTQAVIQAIWEFPRFFIIAASFAYQWCFEYYFSNNNAYMELVKRSNAGTALLERLGLVVICQGGRSINDPWTFEILSFEILMSQPVFLSQLNDNDKKKVVEITLRNSDIMDAIDDRLVWFPNYILIGKTMLSAGYTPFIEAVNDDEELKCFLDGFKDNQTYLYYDMIFDPQTILDFGKEFLNQ